MIDGGIGFRQAVCRQLIITYQTATSLENAAGDFGFFQCHSTRFGPNQKTFWLRVPPASSNESVIGCFCYVNS